jgi:hypothetical protein
MLPKETVLPHEWRQRRHSPHEGKRGKGEMEKPDKGEWIRGNGEKKSRSLRVEESMRRKRNPPSRCCSTFASGMILASLLVTSFSKEEQSKEERYGNFSAADAGSRDQPG